MSGNRMREVQEEEVLSMDEEVPVMDIEASDSGILAPEVEAPDGGVQPPEGEASDNGNLAVGIENGGKKKKLPLPDDYYWLEAIREKRMNKGRAEYLIKWVGWPESDNTWEPFEHLGAELVEAFEQRMQSRKAKSGQKRKPWQKPRTPMIVVVEERSLNPDNRNGAQAGPNEHVEVTRFREEEIDGRILCSDNSNQHDTTDEV